VTAAERICRHPRCVTVPIFGDPVHGAPVACRSARPAAPPRACALCLPRWLEALGSGSQDAACGGGGVSLPARTAGRGGAAAARSACACTGAGVARWPAAGRQCGARAERLGARLASPRRRTSWLPPPACYRLRAYLLPSVKWRRRLTRSRGCGSEHRRAGEIDVVNKRCRHLGCLRRPSFGAAVDKVVAWCAKHANRTLHVDLRHPRCQHHDCTRTPSFG